MPKSKKVEKKKREREKLYSSINIWIKTPQSSWGCARHNAIASHHLFNVSFLSPYTLSQCFSLLLVLEPQEQDFELRFEVVCVLVRLLVSLFFLFLIFSRQTHTQRHIYKRVIRGTQNSRVSLYIWGVTHTQREWHSYLLKYQPYPRIGHLFLTKGYHHPRCQISCQIQQQQQHLTLHLNNNNNCLHQHHHGLMSSSTSRRLGGALTGGPPATRWRFWSLRCSLTGWTTTSSCPCSLTTSQPWRCRMPRRLPPPTPRRRPPTRQVTMTRSPRQWRCTLHPPCRKITTISTWSLRMKRLRRKVRARMRRRRRRRCRHPPPTTAALRPSLIPKGSKGNLQSHNLHMLFLVENYAWLVDKNDIHKKFLQAYPVILFARNCHNNVVTLLIIDLY